MVSRTKAYNYISGCYLLASVGGSAIGSMLLSNHVDLLNALSILCYALTACFAAAIPSQCGRLIQTAEDSQPTLLNSEATASPSSSPEGSRLSPETNTKVTPLPKDLRLFKVNVHQRPLIRILLHSLHASYQSLLTLFQVPNPTLTVILVFLINGLAVRIEVLLPQYASLVLHWPLATVNSALALKALISSLVLFALPTLRKSCLEPRMSTLQIDIFITQASLLANMIGVIGLGFSAPAGFFIISLCVYTSGCGLADSLTTYGTCTLPPGEQVSEFYVRTGLINTIAALIGAPLWSGIFSLVLKSGTLPLGLPYWVCAALYGAGLGGAMALKTWLANGAEGWRYDRVPSNETE